MNREATTLIVEQSAPETRLDSFLRERLDNVSRGTVQRLIESGFIRVNGRHVKLTHHPRAGDRIDIQWPPPLPAEARPEDIPLEVLFEDADLLVVNKPPGLVVHPSAGHQEGTLVNALLHHCAGQLSGVGGIGRPGIVHRLDKDTSGCLVVAKHDVAHAALAARFAKRDLMKVYLAVVCGVLKGDKGDKGDIRLAIARHPNHRKRMTVTSGGRDAWTSYRVRERFDAATWVEANLHTGRTHQIRVHFHHLGHPIAGDDIYGKRANALLKERSGYSAPRQLLHAWRLGFPHPTTGAHLVFEAPVPADFEAGLRALRKCAIPVPPRGDGV